MIAAEACVFLPDFLEETLASFFFGLDSAFDFFFFGIQRFSKGKEKILT